MNTNGIIETALYVNDPVVSAVFYRRAVGAEPILEVERLHAMSIDGKSVLLLFRRGQTEESLQSAGGMVPGHGSTGRGHFAIAIDADQYDTWKQHLADAGIAIESEVTWSAGGKSIYFRDPDENSVELVTPGLWAIY